MLNPCSDQRSAESLGIDRSALLREADRWTATPLDEGERAPHERWDPVTRIIALNRGCFCFLGADGDRLWRG